MKKAKILTLILAIALCVASIVGIAVSADDSSVSVEIISKNLSYDSKISIAFAVEAFGVEAENVSLLVYSSEPESLDAKPDYTVTDSTPMTVYGHDTLVFFTKGIAAKEMTKVVYVRPLASVDGKLVYGETVRYSIAEYAYDIQYRSELGEDYKELGENLLGVGDKIQTLLPYDIENKPSDFLYAYIDAGILDGKYDSGIYKSGDKITLKYTGDEAFTGFSVNYFWGDGSVTSEVVGDNTDIIMSSAHVTVYLVSDIATFEDGRTEAPNITLGRGEFSVARDTRRDAGKVLQVVSWKPETGENTVDNDHAYINVYNTEEYSSDELYASFSGDFYVQNNGSCSGWALELIFEDVGVEGWVYALDIVANSSGKAMKIKHYGKEGADYVAETSLLASSWFTLRLDYHRAGVDSTITVYINGQCVAKDIIAYHTADNADKNVPIDNVQVRFRENNYLFYTDNLSLKTSATPFTPPTMIGDSFSSTSVPSYITVPESGTGVVITNSPTDAANKVLSFVQGSANTPRPGLSYNGISGLTTPYNTLESDVYIKRGTKTGTLSELFFGCDGGAEAFRLKVMYESDGIHLKKWIKNEDGSDSTIDFENKIILPENKWFNLRLDFYLSGLDSYLNIYIDDKLVISEAGYFWDHNDTSRIQKATKLTKLSWQVNSGNHNYAWYFDNFKFTQNLGDFIK